MKDYDYMTRGSAKFEQLNGGISIPGDAELS